MKPPKFLQKQLNGSKILERKILLQIEVSITPTRLVKNLIGFCNYGVFMYFVRKCKLTIREGDNLKQVASSFCKAYSLDNEMKKELVL